ncbi:hypothetical protein PV325_006612 [Microctonus aethiopoides]|nr:hypothetical protein PV325_006612 [Microctonus aethiopoides]
MDVVDIVVDDANYYLILDDSHAYFMNGRGLERLGKYFYEIDLVTRDSYDFLIWMTSGIMDPVNKQVETGLMWSFCSEIHLENYANSRYSCGLLNYPMRTMGWQNRHQIRLTVESQCECYKMHIDYNQELYEADFCNRLLHCVTEQGDSIVVGKPLDGTPCVEDEEEDQEHLGCFDFGSYKTEPEKEQQTT